VGHLGDDFTFYIESQERRLPRRRQRRAPLPPPVLPAVGVPLRLGCCRLSPPEDVELPALVTLHLVKINDAIQRIVDSCPRLADLTVEGCATLQRVSVLDRRPAVLPRRGSHDPGRVGADDSGLQGGGASRLAPGAAWYYPQGRLQYHRVLWRGAIQGGVAGLLKPARQLCRGQSPPPTVPSAGSQRRERILPGFPIFLEPAAPRAHRQPR
jgi:hypothetical protein